MTIIRSTKFPPEALITAPRRSDPTPNAAGTLAIYSVSTYDLDAHKEYKEVRVLKIDDATSTLLSTDTGDIGPQWLGYSDQILYQRSTDGEETELWIANGVGEKRAYFAGKIPSAAGELKSVQLKNGNVGITFSAPTNPKGQIFNPKSDEAPKHTGMEYSTHPIRVWDTWNPYYRFSLYSSTISKQSDGRWKLSTEVPVNLLKGTKLRYPFSAGGVLGENGGYTIGPHGVLLCTPRAGQNTAATYHFSAYFIRLDSFEEKKPVVVQLKTPEYIGPAGSPVFSPDGKKAAFIVARTESLGGSERGIAIFDIDDEDAYEESYATTKLIKFADDEKTTWDRFPGSLVWSHNSNRLYIQAEDRGYERLFSLHLAQILLYGKKPSYLAPAPLRVTDDSGSVSSFALLDRNSTSGTKFLLTSSSYIEPSLYSIFDSTTLKSKPISSISNYGADFGLKSSQIESITISGEKADIQSFIVRPSFFDPKKKYPLALIVHGGPQSAWNNSWSTRWNPALWAEQGYIILLPNPSGSTGFGLEVHTSVLGDWGGRPYRDIVKSVDHVVDNFDYIDSSNIVMCGASYGGYMANWIAGQPLAKRLKAIVSHDGIFHTSSMLASDIIGPLGDDVGAPLWEDIKPWEKWSPANYTKNWSTPMLVVHSNKDFRCPINEGLAVYGVLQAKGIDSRFLYYPDENHWVLKRENSLKWHQTVFGWINHYTGIKDGVQLEPALCDAKFEEDEDEE